jgi:transcriptional regulator with XRE-family HTH domain
MDIKMYQRIKEIRIKHGYKTQQAFADALNTHINTVKSWENEKKPVLPGLDSLLAMCELFDCDLDYLTGRIEESKHDIHDVHEYTGLSEKAIRRITHPKVKVNGSPVPSPTAISLNRLIESDGFNDFMEAYMAFTVAADRLKESAIPRAKPYTVDQDGNIVIDGTTSGGAYNVIQKDKVTLSLSAGTHYYMWTLSQALMRICEKEYQESYKMSIKNSKDKDTNNDRRDE